MKTSRLLKGTKRLIMDDMRFDMMRTLGSKEANIGGLMEASSIAGKRWVVVIGFPCF